MNFNINKVAVLGAGVMGAGIAAHMAGAGIPVLLMDIVPKTLDPKEEKKGLTLDSPIVRNRFAANGKAGVTNPRARAIYDKDFGDLIEVGNFEDDLHRISECDWIIEVILEDLTVKQNFFKEVAKYRRPGTIVSSNTSGVSINKITDGMTDEFKAHFLGTHFFNPPRYMKLFELIPNENTAPELMAYMSEFGTHKLGKGVVNAKDTPNFVGNRIGTYSIMTVLQQMEKFGFSVEKVDALTGQAIGRPKSATFKTMDMVGLDIVLKVAGNVISNIDDAEEIAKHEAPKWIVELIERGQLGNKTKQGVYKRDKVGGKKVNLVWDSKALEYVPSERVELDLVKAALKSDNKYKTMTDDQSEEGKFTWEVIKNVLLYSASKVPEIADDYKQIDNAMRWGFNWEIGPFQIWDMIGVEASVARMEKEGETVPEWVSARLSNGQKHFYDQATFSTPYLSLAAYASSVIKENAGAALLDIGDGIACLKFKSKGNSITDEVMEMIHASVAEVESNYKGLVIANEGGNFSVGANLMQIAQLSQSQDWGELAKVIEKFQTANMALKYCRKPVVAAPYGMTLGGGAEVVMHSHTVTAHAETYMGLVEVGVGLIPAGGGTKEMLIRTTEGVGKANTGELIGHVRKAWESIATAKVSGSAHEAMKNMSMRKSDKVVMNSDYVIEKAKTQALHMSQAFVPKRQEKIKVLGHTGRAALEYVSEFMYKGKFISEYDKYIADQVAYILTGGDVPAGIYVSEERILELEREVFVNLCKEEKTQQRIEHMLKTGKPLRN